MSKLKIDRCWTLFLDRDGVINRRIPGAYINTIDDFQILPGVLDAISSLSKMFNHVIVVTNQQGIRLGLLTPGQLEAVHNHLLSEVSRAGGCIDSIYYCGDLARQPGNCRKPSPAMAMRAKSDYHDIDFSKSIMVGDSISDVAFGQNLGMKTILVGEQLGYPDPQGRWRPDFILEDLRNVLSIVTSHG